MLSADMPSPALSWKHTRLHIHSTSTLPYLQPCPTSLLKTCLHHSGCAPCPSFSWRTSLSWQDFPKPECERSSPCSGSDLIIKGVEDTAPSLLPECLYFSLGYIQPW